MNRYDERAGNLQAMHNPEPQREYDENETREATIHTREDIILVVSYLSSANDQLQTIRRLLWFIVALFVLVLSSRLF